MNIDEWLSPLGRYAERLHQRAGDGHHVVSPLGAWMVVALCAHLAADEGTRAELADVLGADPDAAAEFAAKLLADSHPLVAAAAGVWLRPGYETIQIDQWRDWLPPVVETGGIPSQEEIDRWAAERTLGLIEQFPIELTPDVVCLLATALATKVSWEVPFEVVDATALSPSPWSTRVKRVLRWPQGDPRHHQYLVDTHRAGLVAVHTASARGGLLVGSVIAVDPAVASGDVWAVAEQIVPAEAQRWDREAPFSLFDLPLGEGPVFSITEEEVDTNAPNRREEHFVSLLPAWSAHTDIDLQGDRTLGFPAAARTVAEALQLGDWRYDARQRALARYSAIGFEAGAVTGLAVAAAYTPSSPGRRRIATVRFGHPFAVVAAATEDLGAFPRSLAGSAWWGLPVFSAWVSEPTDADPPPPPM